MVHSLNPLSISVRSICITEAHLLPAMWLTYHECVLVVKATDHTLRVTENVERPKKKRKAQLY